MNNILLCGMPVYRNFIETPSSKLGLWKISESYTELLNNCLVKGFDVMEQGKFRSELKQKQWLAARCLINKMNPEIREINYDNFGAPHVKIKYFISLSHSNKFIAVLFDNSDETGVDIQHINPKINIIKNKFCSAPELEIISKEKSIEQLHLIWSVKEAIYKKVKRPGLNFKEQIFTEPFELSTNGHIRAKVILSEKTFFIPLKYEIIEDYILAYTVNP